MRRRHILYIHLYLKENIFVMYTCMYIDTGCDLEAGQGQLMKACGQQLMLKLLRRLCHAARMSAVWHSRHVCCLTQQTCLLCCAADISAVHHSRLVCCVTADMSAVSHSRHVCIVTQQKCLLCHAADMSIVWDSRYACCVTQ